MKAVKITENIYWVGGIDWKIREFHGYVTERGSTYNAFLVIDEKITLIDIRYIRSDILEKFIEFKNQDVLFLYSTTVLNNGIILK